jgi:predicted nucleic acid-binding protein
MVLSQTWPEHLLSGGVMGSLTRVQRTWLRRPPPPRIRDLIRTMRMGTMDLKIAAIVLSREAPLLSHNLEDFDQVTGLQVEDWTA